MNNQKQTNPQLKQLGDLIKPIRVAMMTMVDEESALISKPVAMGEHATLDDLSPSTSRI